MLQSIHVGVAPWPGVLARMHRALTARPTSGDAELLRLCAEATRLDREDWEANEACCTPLDNERLPFHPAVIRCRLELPPLLRHIGDIRPVTLTGLRAKAKLALLVVDRWEQSVNQCYGWDVLAWGVARDLATEV